jgi:type III secretory pathway component EscU
MQPCRKVFAIRSILEISAMKTNVGSLDRLIRLLLASALFYLGLLPYSGSALGIGLVVAGGVLLVTALVGFCGLYRLLGIHTNQPNEQF